MEEKIKLVIEIDKWAYDKLTEQGKFYGGNTLYNAIFEAVAQGKPYESKYVIKGAEK